MDTTRTLVLGTVGAISILAFSVLVGLGKVDPVVLGSLSVLVTTVMNLILTASVDKKVNGHLTTLIESKTQPALTENEGEVQ